MMFATIYIPNFHLQAALRHCGPDLPPGLNRNNEANPTPPAALIDEQDKKPVILQLNASAESAGVRQGMTPSQGLARCLHLLIKARSVLQETVVQEILLHHAFTLTPYVENTAPGLCTVQFTDTRNLSGKVARVMAELAACEITAQAGLGPASDTSFLAAHLARPVLQIDDAQKFLAPLPIEILAIDVDND
jgi:protein ImuB